MAEGIYPFFPLLKHLFSQKLLWEQVMMSLGQLKTGLSKFHLDTVILSCYSMGTCSDEEKE